MDSYDVILGYTVRELIEAVNQAMERSKLRPIGGISVEDVGDGKSRYWQAMAIPKEDDLEMRRARTRGAELRRHLG